MIEEPAQVTAVERGRVWVTTQRQSTCSSCSARVGCGQGLWSELSAGKRDSLCIDSDLLVAVGDQVVVGVGEDLLVKASLIVYLLPLLGLFAAGLLAQFWQLSELWVVVSAVGGFTVVCALVRWHSKRAANQPSSASVSLRAVAR